MFFYKLYQNDKSQGYDGYINGILKEGTLWEGPWQTTDSWKKKRENLSDHEKGLGRNKVEILKTKGDEMWEVGV